MTKNTNANCAAKHVVCATVNARRRPNDFTRPATSATIEKRIRFVAATDRYLTA
jgi:hypothetical protein